MYAGGGKAEHDPHMPSSIITPESFPPKLVQHMIAGQAHRTEEEVRR